MHLHNKLIIAPEKMLRGKDEDADGKENTCCTWIISRWGTGSALLTTHFLE